MVYGGKWGLTDEYSHLALGYTSLHNSIPTLYLLSFHSFLQTTYTTITSFIHEYKQHIQQLNDPSLSFLDID